MAISLIALSVASKKFLRANELKLSIYPYLRVPSACFHILAEDFNTL